MAVNRITAKVAELGGLCGITPEYVDNFGRRHATAEATYRALLTAMRVPWEDPERLDQEIARRRPGPWGALLEPVQVVAPENGPARTCIRVWSPTAAAPSFLEVRGEITGERSPSVNWETLLINPEAQGTHPVQDGFRVRMSLPLPQDLEWGYYDLALWVRAGGREEAGKTRLIVAPERAYFPEGLAHPQRLWGFNVPLYALRSATDWGIGDFGSLQAMIRWAGSLGAAFVGVNPCHAPGGSPDADPSPYGPGSRSWLNFLYLNLEEAPELAACPEAQALLASPEFQAALARLRRAPLVQYGEVYRLKWKVLTHLYQTFARVHGDPEAARTSRGREFGAFLSAQGDSLQRYGQFGALTDHFAPRDWRGWPEAYRHPASPAVADFSRAHLPMIRTHQYGQWLAAGQLAEVCRQARDQGLPFSLYEDLALGASPGGYDTWAHQELFALGADLGAPPDAFNPRGQNWGLPPLIPERLRESGYQLFIDTLRANLPPDGMLRVDHVMGLFRLLWIPAGETAARGAYVRYPARELLAILALESVRRRAVIIGEDLGTVPSWVRGELAQTGILSYRVFWFERDGAQRFLPPEDYPRMAMAAVTTHDLPTLAGFCEGRDLALKQALQLYATPEMAESDAKDRERDRRLLAETLEHRGLLPAGAGVAAQTGESCPPELREAVFEYLAQSQAALLEVRLEDVFGMAEQQNLPGTIDEHPNWRQKMDLTLEEMAQAPEAAQLAARLNKYRGRKKL